MIYMYIFKTVKVILTIIDIINFRMEIQIYPPPKKKKEREKQTNNLTSNEHKSIHTY